MKALKILGVFALVACVIVAWRVGGNRAAALQDENAALRAELAAAKEMAVTASVQRDAQAADTNALEIARLRGEVTQLRSAAKELDSLKARNAQLQAQAQQLRAQPVVAPANPAPQAAPGEFPRESWTFAGYASPESALVSAIWAMREGNPKTYLDSLAPEEQSRMAQLWANKDQAEIAAKHQSDVSKISAFRIVDRQEVSPEQVTMSVYIGGVDRLEKVSMQKVGNDWKFGGFIRDAKR